ncbi:DNA alkylation repair protein [Kordiimonas laminariae]|uniref:DNA alkylation repair protein n=1 Tax=Kordiimonas laminariae TaxID=2917717 RepID=UPI001FF5EFD2|nr:DNA alkylation repair protein [Kordiimonas laminariae]MCK0068538.1 DNA alkylation repair protein [Kordiimonas laminariae]
MAEAFKNAFNEQVITLMADILKRTYPAFRRDDFICSCMETLEALELKERVGLIVDRLDRFLPAGFDEFANILLGAMHPAEDNTELAPVECDETGLRGFPAWPLIDAVTKRGIDVPEKALPVLKELTKRFSAEFAIRPFIAKYPDYCASVFREWIKDKNRHVRRLVSEGSRPRLPWGIQLKALVTDPAPMLPYLEALRDDEEEYVRRSVANHLNDIAKDHPDLVAGIAADWLKDASKNRERLVRHACRTLIKQGHKGVLQAFDYGAVGKMKADIRIHTSKVVYGEALAFDVAFSGGVKEQGVMVDYAIHFVKANGSTAPKVFKWKDTKLDKTGALKAGRKHAIKPITTRKYYAGEHQLEIIVNGVSLSKQPFTLVM